ncbi:MULTISPECIES: hypothetical protein [unclassified Rhodococcus (in: high G+C Gram-positive bacteria)]|uniref:hypothetical protein n=1 Tax=unclassified Rhodococcus (in: high G+C Gram-positive bacteria) TaxID=192944 RepID=UPI00163991DE|nr:MULTISPECIES: hypothetical protein [unclassified Rhodococcus (in: high G+C Gram-positive bacteria)]MBC2644173.1 hypothetical protein [Rhodococcus sp. 3A]MBC2891088.1 hypothetical protein [Rhodococcus sp. 4CII]
MRSFIHLVLFACAIAVAIGAFLPVVGGIAPSDVAVIDLRDGFPTGITVEQIENQAVTFYQSMTALLLGAAALLLVAALVGSRAAEWLAVSVGIGTIAVFGWRLNDSVGDYLRDNYDTMLTDRWGLYLAGGGLIVALLALLVPTGRLTAE